MGKSSLAWLWLQFDLRRTGSDARAWIAPEEEPRALLWYSFYEIGASFPSFLRTAHRYFVGSETDSNTSIESVVAAMRKVRGIVVLDGLERQLLGFSAIDQPHRAERAAESLRYCADSRLAKFLEAIASVPGKGSKVLITSRLMPKELDTLAGAIELRLPGLDIDEGIQFLQKEALGADPDDIQKVARKYCSHPLALRLAAGLLSDPNTSHLAIGDSTEPVVDTLRQGRSHILQAAFDALEPADRSFLALLSAFRGATTFEAAMTVLDAANEPTRFWKQVRRLVDRGLLWTNRNQKLFDLHPIVRLYAYSRLTDKTGAADRIRNFFEAIPTPITIETIEQAEPVFEICYQYARAGRYEEACRTFLHKLWMDVSVKLGEQASSLQLFELFFPNGWDEHSAINGSSQEPELIDKAAQLLSSAGRYHDVIALLMKRLENKAQSIGGNRRHLAYALVAVGRFNDGIRHFEEALILEEDVHERGHIHDYYSTVLDKLAMEEGARKHVVKMKECYKKADMLDARHLFEIATSEFRLTESLAEQGRILKELEKLTLSLGYKSAVPILEGIKMRFLVRRLTHAQNRSRLTLWLSQSRPRRGDRIVAEQLIEHLLQEERNAGDLKAESSLLACLARLTAIVEIERARAAALESVRLAQSVEDIFTKIESIGALAEVEWTAGNRERYRTLVREVLDIIPDEKMASQLRRRLQARLDAKAAPTD
jgi:tetratricopeptide (TPR) repeat protein